MSISRKSSSHSVVSLLQEKMSLKTLLTTNKSPNTSFKETDSTKKVRFKSVVIHQPKGKGTSVYKKGKPDFRVIKIAKENVVPYEEFLHILEKPSIFVIKWLNTSGCCNRRQIYTHFEITNIAGICLFRGKHAVDSIRVFDTRNRLFMMLHYSNYNSDEEINKVTESAVLSVPNSNIPLAELKYLPTYIPYNQRFSMVSEHFPELNINVEQQTLPGWGRGTLWRHTMTGLNRRVISRFLQPCAGKQMYVLVDEDVSTFQKCGVLASAIFISKRPQRSFGRMLCITLIFVIVFLFGFYIVSSKVFELRHKFKNSEFDSGGKFPHKLKSGEESL